MSFVTAAVIGGIGTVAGAAIAGDAAKDAAQTQADAAGDASRVQLEMFNRLNAQQQPFIQSGYGANAMLSRLMGLAPEYQAQAGGVQGSPVWDSSNGRLVGDTYLPPDVQLEDAGNGWYAVKMPDGTYLGNLRPGGANGRFEQVGSPVPTPQQVQGGTSAPAPVKGGTGATDQSGLPTGYLTQTFGPQQFLQGMDPGYAWRFQQGAQAVQNSAAAGSGSLSGPALKALMDYGQGAASQEYGAAFDRFQTQQGNIYQRLTGLVGLGQNAAANVGNQGVATGANVGANIVGAGNAAAAGQIGQANAYAGALGNLGSLGMLWAMNQNQPAPVK